MNPELEAILAGFAPEDADKIRAAIPAPVEVVAPVVEEIVAEPAVDVAAEVARQVAEGMESVRATVAEIVETATAPVAESNDEGTEDLVSDVVSGVRAIFEERIAAVEVAVDEQRDASVPGALAGGKPAVSTETAAAAQDAIDADLERMAADPQTAPRMIERALRRYADENGAYVPSDAPRVNVAPEHLQLLQASHIPGEDFHFDFGSGA